MSARRRFNSSFLLRFLIIKRSLNATPYLRECRVSSSVCFKEARGEGDARNIFEKKRKKENKLNAKRPHAKQLKWNSVVKTGKRSVGRKRPSF